MQHELLQVTRAQDVFECACRALVRLGGYRMAWVGVAEHDTAHTVRAVAHAGIADGYLENIQVSWADDVTGRGPTGTAIRTHSPIVVHNVLTDPTYEPWRLEALRRGYASSVAVPLISGHGRCDGAINIYAEEPDAFGRREVDMLERLAAEITIAVRRLGDG